MRLFFQYWHLLIPVLMFAGGLQCLFRPPLRPFPIVEGLKNTTKIMLKTRETWAFAMRLRGILWTILGAVQTILFILLPHIFLGGVVLQHILCLISCAVWTCEMFGEDTILHQYFYNNGQRKR